VAGDGEGGGKGEGEGEGTEGEADEDEEDEEGDEEGGEGEEDEDEDGGAEGGEAAAEPAAKRQRLEDGLAAAAASTAAAPAAAPAPVTAFAAPPRAPPPPPAPRAAHPPVSSKRSGVPQSFYPLMQLEDAFHLLLRHVDMRAYIVYSALRAAGLVVVRHRQQWARHYRDGGSAEATALTAKRPRVVYPPAAAAERPLEVVYDVYVRDGFTSYKPSSPGPPDCFLLVVA
jgi:hypothetical protein